MRLSCHFLSFSAFSLVSAQESSYITSDYLLALLEGLKIDRYVDGGITCATSLRNVQYDGI